MLSCAGSAQASARVSGARAARIRAALSRQVKRDPAVITRPWFLRRAGLVKFALPVTLRLRTDSVAGATADLGPALGSRSIVLDGSLAAQVLFSDDFDGGALGDVGIEFLPSDTKFLRSSSIPLLWNSDVSDPATRSDANFLGATGAGTGADRQGCGDFTAAGAGGATASPGYSALAHGLPSELPGYPYYDAGGPGGSLIPAGYLPIYPGVDAIDRLKSGDVAGDNDSLGPSDQPFPGGSAQDTVLRTNALQLQVAPAGTQVDGTAAGSDNLVISRSGGHANLFGNIPGKPASIDVTLSLQTKINSIVRMVDQDVSGGPAQSGGSYPPYLFQCRQMWTGAVQNYIPGIHLLGDLKIAPAITPDGHLRIAKATVSSPPGAPARVALTACLAPSSMYAQGDADPPVPAESDALIPVDSDLLPIRADAERFAPTHVLGAAAPSDTACNAPSEPLLRSFGLDPLSQAASTSGYTTTADGSQVSVAGDITVNRVTVDVLIGDA